MSYPKTILRHIIVWTLAFSILNFLREYGHEIVRKVEELNSFSWTERILFQLFLGIVSGILFGTYAFFFEKLAARRKSFGKTVMLGAIGYVAVIVIFIVLAFIIFGLLFGDGINLNTIIEYFTSGEFLVLIFFCLLVGILIEFVSQMDRSLGRGNLLKMITGRFYRPKEEERVFMFLDMRSSTTIAEKLGHLMYSQLVQDCFRDLEVVKPFHTEVYQYVGDEVVLTWESNRGLINDNCIQAYFAFQKRLNDKTPYYQEKYGVVPEFKAGLNLGSVTVAEVGEIKREIAYHGDTLNTAARIQTRCNEYGKDFLASGELIQKISGVAQTEFLGEEVLRGKGETVEIYSISQL